MTGYVMIAKRTKQFASVAKRSQLFRLFQRKENLSLLERINRTKNQKEILNRKII